MPVSRREMQTRDAAKLLPGMSQATLEKWMRDAYMMEAKPVPFAEAVLTERGEWQYYVFPKRLKAYLEAKDLTLVKEVTKSTT